MTEAKSGQQEEQRWGLAEVDIGDLFEDDISLGSGMSSLPLDESLFLADDVVKSPSSVMTGVRPGRRCVSGGSKVNNEKGKEEEVSRTTELHSSRFVSVDGMKSLMDATTKKRKAKSGSDTSTPYDSLKELVKKKCNKNGATGATAAKSMPHPVSLHSFPDVRSKPSSFLRQALYGGSPSSPVDTGNFIHNDGVACKRRKAMVEVPCQENDAAVDSLLLHRACTQADKDSHKHTIENILRVNPRAAERGEVLMTEKLSYDGNTQTMKLRGIKEKYTYPLNIAIEHGAEADVIEKLLLAAPAVVSSRDGSQRESSLSVLIKYRPSDVDLVDVMLLKNPACASLPDRHDNTALHVACMHGACMDVVRHLCALYPEACKIRNFHGLTPLQLAQRKTSACSNEVASFLFRKQLAGN